MSTFIIDSTPINLTFSFCKGTRQIVGNCLYKLNKIPIFVMEPILATTQATILVSSQILTSYILDINT
jgi:hypothetical protein